MQVTVPVLQMLTVGGRAKHIQINYCKIVRGDMLWTRIPTPSRLRERERLPEISNASILKDEINSQGENSCCRQRRPPIEQKGRMKQQTIQSCQTPSMRLQGEAEALDSLLLEF